LPRYNKNGDKTLTLKPFNTRALLVNVDRYPRVQQIKDCKKAVEEFGLPQLGKSIYECNELDCFLSNLKRDEIALIPRLEGLALKKGRGVGKRFERNLLRVCSTCLYILDVDTGIRSDAGKDWDLLVEDVYNKLTRSRGPLDKEKARAIGAIPNKEPGLVEDWIRKRKAMTDDYIAHARIWGNLGIRPAERAISQFPDKELRDVSKSTIHRIFDTRIECQEWLNENL